MLHVTHKFSRIPSEALSIDTASAKGLWGELSPFLLPGGPLYDGHEALRHENAWQFAKLYAEHADAQGEPTEAYWAWAKNGWADSRAHRYPMGKGAKPLCSLWEGRRLGYIEARKKIYAPLYARAVVKTQAYAELRELLRTTSQDIYLRDWDGYDHLVKNLTISEVANNPRKKMGHAFVLWALIEGQYEQLVADTPQPTQFNF